MRIWLVGLSLLVAGSPAVQEVPVGETRQGVVFWHGHRLDPPFRLRVAFRAEPDTVWLGTTINGLTLDGLRAPIRPRPVSSRDSGQVAPERRASAVRGALERVRERTQRGDSGGYARLLGEEFRALRTMVDSVEVRPPTEVFVHWKGQSRPETIRIGRSESPPPSSDDLRAMHRKHAASTLSFLSSGGLLVISQGHLVVPAGRSLEVLAEIDSLQAGLTPHLRHLHGSMREELRHPEPLDSLRLRAPR